MKLYPIETGNFKLDGGAMFGVVPKSIWQRTNPADDRNMIDLAARALLVENGDRLTLIDTGFGEKQSEKFFGYYSMWGEHSLDRSLAQHGFNRQDVTDVFLTHLHFDHCGGCIEWNGQRTGYRPAFPRARFWSNAAHWDWAVHPNPREKASFLKENIAPIQESGQLEFLPVDPNAYLQDSPLGFSFICVDGHTEKQMLPVIEYQGQRLVYAADLIPTAGHIPLVYIMGYDTRPLLTMEEKARFLDWCVEERALLFFEHDAYHQMARLQRTEKGVILNEILGFNEIFGP